MSWGRRSATYLPEAVLGSSPLGLRKPDARIYTELLDRLSIAPEDTAFVDDLPENMAPAQELGIRVVRFESVEQCRGELFCLGALDGAIA